MTSLRPQVFITGGQTGADSIVFPLSKEFDIKIEGWMPRGFKRDDGKGEEIAKEFGLKESTVDSFAWKDEANARMSDALIGFLTTKPKTGKGTMQTASVFIRGWYRREDKSWIPIETPEKEKGIYVREYDPAKKESLKPALLIWDLSERNLGRSSLIIEKFLKKYKPERLMVTGPTESTSPDIIVLGTKSFRDALKEL